jgi:hypothetical protein
MYWTDPKPPTEGISYYDHTIASTPLGTILIEWKSWKKNPSYDITIGGEWLGCEYELEIAKEVALKYLRMKYDSLKEYLNN